MTRNVVSGIILTLLFTSMLPSAFIIQPVKATDGTVPATLIYVDPSSISADVGESFTITVNIQNVEDLWGYEVKVGFDKNVLEPVSTEEGPFIKDQTTSPSGTFSIYSIYDDYVDFCCVTFGPYPGVSGSGTLFSITFYAKNAGTSNLPIYDSILVDHTGTELPHTYGPSGRPVLVTGLEISPGGPYCVGDVLTATFSIQNQGDATITLDKLLLGGRFNGGTLPNGEFPDFTFQTVTLQPEQSYQYAGTLELTEAGNYGFFVAYYIQDPTGAEKKLLDENNWNTCIDLAEGLTDNDRAFFMLVHETVRFYIRADGSVDPPTTRILNVGNVYYTFTADIHGSIVIERDNIVIDGNGYTLQGTGAYPYKDKGIDLSERTNATVKNTQIKNFWRGIQLGRYSSGSFNNSISGNNITNNYEGIWFVSVSNYNSISGNNIANNDYGIRLDFSSNYNSISGNNITSNREGIELVSSSCNSISGNNITSNREGVTLFFYSSSNNISGNNMANNYNCIWIDYYSNYNNISGNNIANNDYGIRLYSFSSNRFWHNNFIDNTNQVYSYNSICVWDDGYPSGGNYWSDYEERYPDATEIGDSGIWGTPYFLDENNQDNYPLVDPWAPTPTTGFWLEVSSLAGTYMCRDIQQVHAYRSIPIDFIFEKDLEEGHSTDDVQYLQIVLNANPSTQVADSEAGSPSHETNYFGGLTKTAVSRFQALYGLTQNGRVDEDTRVELNKLLEILAYDPVKHVPKGWVLKGNIENGKPVEGTPDGIRWFYRVEDATDGLVGWVERGDLEEGGDAEKTKIVIFAEDSEISPAFRFDEKNLRYGQENSEILRLQIILKHKGIFPTNTPVTGRYLDITKEAVRAFQERYGNLDGATGDVGEETVGKLNEILENDCTLTKSRASLIWAAINDFRTEFLPDNFPPSLILAISILESPIHFDNEYVKPVPGDRGRGIMQITTFKYVGLGSGTRCYECREDSEDYRCYYTNTVQGIEANIKDGLYALRDKHQDVKIEETQAPEGYTKDEVIWMSTVQRYNGFTLAHKPSEYLFYVGDRLIGLADGDYGDFQGLDEESARLLGEKFQTAYSERITLYSPAQLRVYDDEGNVAGLLNGEIKEDIPNSIYDNETRTVFILFPSNDYCYNVVGLEEATYGVDIVFSKEDESVLFAAIDIPTSANAVHQYTVDWNALSLGEEGVIVQVDSDGDDVFEHTFASDDELTISEYVIGTDGTPPETWLNIGQPKYVVSDATCLTSATPIELITEDNAGGSGVASTAYRIYNASYDSGWASYTEPFYLIGLSDSAYQIDYNSTDLAGNVEPSNTVTVILDYTGPSVTAENPPAGWALQDGVTFIIAAVDASGTSSVNLSIREANGGEGTPVGFEDLPAVYDAVTGKWTLFFDTLQLPDGYYIVIVNAEDNLGHASSTTVAYSIRNWAVLELLPASENNKAGRTMPIKFALRVAAAVDPLQPFVYNEDLTIDVYATDTP
ncbi:MAG: right-handed parallel beta-helix repeat-containing protein, partial [Candidatus Bathyarchaeota archaeon]